LLEPEAFAEQLCLPRQAQMVVALKDKLRDVGIYVEGAIVANA
jgi:hypothetical protein